MRLPILLAVLVISGAAVPAMAGQSCTTAAKAEWKPMSAALEKATSLGYTTSKAKEEDNCWEVYAKNAKGEKFELFFNPATLELVRTKAN